jgi:hypothetical protein
MRRDVRGGEPDRAWSGATELEIPVVVSIIGGVRAIAASALTGSGTSGVDALWVKA